MAWQEAMPAVIIKFGIGGLGFSVHNRGHSRASDAEDLANFDANADEAIIVSPLGL